LHSASSDPICRRRTHAATKQRLRDLALTDSVKLTAMAKAGGCAAKLNPAILDAVLRKLPRQTNPDVLVGFDTNDDAGIYRLDDRLALVQTVDFFTPIVDDPRRFGEIAAANALSDVYAMGGRPISSLAVVGLPEKDDPEILEEIMRGGLAKMTEANCSVIGGHSIRNEEMLFGYAVTGVIEPQRIWRNVGALAGDALLFTKPLGTGVITTALKKGAATSESLQAAIDTMTTLNREAANVLRAIENVENRQRPIHAVTDVTGFSLLGHAREMALGSILNGAESVEPVSFEINHAAFAYLQGAELAARDGHISDGLKHNRAFVGDCVQFADHVPSECRDLLFDPQTSGGLLIAIAPDFADRAVAALQRQGVAARQVGKVVAKRSPLICVS
jgi:selenide, water dikinase